MQKERTPEELLSSMVLRLDYVSAREAIDEIAKFMGWDVIREYIKSRTISILINGEKTEWFNDVISYEDIIGIAGYYQKEQIISITIRTGCVSQIVYRNEFVRVYEGSIINAFDTSGA